MWYKYLGFDVLPGSGVIRVVLARLGLVVEVSGGVEVVVGMCAEEPPRDRLVLEPNGAGRLIFKTLLACLAVKITTQMDHTSNSRENQVKVGEMCGNVRCSL